MCFCINLFNFVVGYRHNGELYVGFGLRFAILAVRRFYTSEGGAKSYKTVLRKQFFNNLNSNLTSKEYEENITSF